MDFIKRWSVISIFCVLAGFSLIYSQQGRASEEDLYDFLWLDPDKSVYVLQNKVYRKKNTFFTDISFAKNDSSDFQNSIGYHATLGYYFHEIWGVDLYYTGYKNSNNDSYLTITKVDSKIPFIRKVNSLFGLGVVWSPFYGKINTFNQIIYFDWMLGFGVGKISTESNLTYVLSSNQNRDNYDGESQSAYTFKTMFKFYWSRNFNVHLEIWDTLYWAPGPRDPSKDVMRQNFDVLMGVGFVF